MFGKKKKAKKKSYDNIKKRAMTYSRKKKRRIWPFLLLFLLVIAGGAIYFVLHTYTVRTVYVEGNKHYSQDEIKEMVMSGRYGHNSIYLSLKYKNKGVMDIPFVETMDVTILSPDTIKITVYEKSLAGYVEYLGRFLYFDKDGIVVESSSMKTDGIPLVSGLQFGHVVLYKKLPVENDKVFNSILSITQLLNKYNVEADKIYFNSDFEMTLFFGNVRVTLGSKDYMDEKIMKLQYILPELEGKSGTLRMDSVTDETQTLTFDSD